MQISKKRLLFACLTLHSAVCFPVAYARGLAYHTYVTEGEAHYLRSLRRRLPPDATILMLGNDNEWAPLLAQRTILNIWYGQEWAPDKQKAITQYTRELEASHTAEDLMAAIELMHRRFPDYFPIPHLVYISKYDEHPRRNPAIDDLLVEDLRTSDCFQVESDNHDVAVFRLGAGCADCR